MLGIRFSLAVLGTVLALSAAATDAEAGHRRHQCHQQQQCHYQQHGHQQHGHQQQCYQQHQCCSQGHHTQHVHQSHSGYGHSGNDSHNCCQPMKSNACCGVDQWQHNGSCQNRVSNCQMSGGWGVISMTSAPAAHVTPVPQNPPPTTVNKVVAPATFSQEPSDVENPPQPTVSQAAVPAAAK